MSTTPAPGPQLSPNTPRRAFLQTCAAVSTGLLFANRLPAKTEPSADSNCSDIWTIFRTRRSVRKFKQDAVPEADLLRILDAARSAPTSGNQQPWKFLVVRDSKQIAALQAANVERMLGQSDPKNPRPEEEKRERENKIRSRLAGYFSAPVYIVILTDNQSTYPDYNHWDGPLAAGYLMLAARALGYGTVFVTDVIPDAITKKVLKIPDRYTRVCITPLGVPEAWPDSPAKKTLDDFIAWETF